VSELRQITSDAEAVAAAALGPDETGFWVRAPLSEDGYRHLAARLADRPDAWLSLGAHGTTDLEMLVQFPGLRRLRVTSLRLASWEGVRYVADSLERLSMGETTLRPVSIRPIGALRSLRTLGLIGPVKDADMISGLEEVEELYLRSVTLPDLSTLLRMRRLRVLYLGLGGTADLGLLPKLANLEELELWRIRGLHDLTPIAGAVNLAELSIQAMSAVTELPTLSRLRRLRRVKLETMKGITDLRPVADAPALEELLLIDMCQLQPDALRPLVGHRTLRKGIWGLCSDRKNAEAWELLPLGDPPWNYERWKARTERAAAREAKRRASPGE
jgi:hypothetical protein